MKRKRGRRVYEREGEEDRRAAGEEERDQPPKPNQTRNLVFVLIIFRLRSIEAWIV